MTAQTQAFTQSVFGFKSERNSSIVALAASATFTGLAETFASNEVFVAVKTDQDGTVFLDFSDDNGVTFEVKSFPVTANEYKEIHEFKAARTFRVRFTNTSGSPQTALSLNTYYGDFSSAVVSNGLSVPSGDATVGSAIVVGNATSVTILAENKDRRYMGISALDDNVWVKLQPASTDNDEKGVFVPRNFLYELPANIVYTGEVSAISDTGTATVYVTEF